MYESLEEWLTIHLEHLTHNKYYIQKNRLSYFMNVKNCLKDPEYRQGSVCSSHDMEVQIQSKFEMLQSSLYPPQMKVSNEIFSLILVQFKALPSMKDAIKL